MSDTPRCNALESNPLDSFDYRAWVTLAKELELELRTAPEAQQKVFVVTCGWDYEGSDVKAVVATRKEAEELVEKYGDSEHFSYDNIDIEEWTVGEVTDKRWEPAPLPQQEGK